MITVTVVQRSPLHDAMLCMPEAQPETASCARRSLCRDRAHHATPTPDAQHDADMLSEQR